jgi:tetratricopeptide (TPR) repeat protein
VTTSPKSPDPEPPPPRRAFRSLRRIAARGPREQLWAFLDLLDARPALKRALLIGLPVIAIAAGLGAWGYRRWARHNSVRIARQWLDAGRLDRAGAAVRDALATEPGLPASWRLASELAWRKGNRAASVEYAKRAAAVSGYGTDEVLAWAEASVLSGDADEAEDAEAYLDPSARQTPRALRLAGEVARRGRRFAAARDDFQAALREDISAGAQSLAPDDVPLGIVSLQTGAADDRAKGQALLSKWASDPNWGVEALRALLADAVAHGDRKSATLWAENLRMNQRCTLGDIPVCMQALVESDTAAYQAMIGPLEEESRSKPTRAALLLGWLTQIGQGAEAVRWGQSLDPAVAGKPPVAPAIAEALRATGRWSDLQAWVGQGDWGRDLGFMQWAYGLVAARRLGDASTEGSLWASLRADGISNPAHALFAGDSLYAWGFPKEAAELLWSAADRADLGYEALGSLARLYQVQRDAEGQYRAFSRLNTMRPYDRKIANNYAYFAALTDLGSQTHVEPIAKDNFTHEPGSAVFRSTYAFVLVWSGQASRAMKLLVPVSHEWKTSPAVAFAYGSALAALGRKDEAREVFDSLDPRSLDPKEADWIQAALR